MHDQNARPDAAPRILALGEVDGASGGTTGMNFLSGILGAMDQVDEAGASPMAWPNGCGARAAHDQLALRPRHLDAGFGQAVADLHRQLGAHGTQSLKSVVQARTLNCSSPGARPVMMTAGAGEAATPLHAARDLHQQLDRALRVRPRKPVLMFR